MPAFHERKTCYAFQDNSTYQTPDDTTRPNMANMEEIYFEPTFKFLICKRHGSGVHPTKQAVKRHLRNEDHRCGGETLKQAVSALSTLPLRSLKDTLEATPA